MTDLPIKISNAAPAQASLKQTGNDSANREDEQGFSNVLARQVGDADKQPLPSRPSKDKGAPAEEQHRASAEEADSMPAGVSAEMLATLLVQQNPDDFARLAADTSQESPKTGKIIADARGRPSALPAASGAYADDKMSGALLPAAAPGTPEIAGNGKLETADRVKVARLHEHAVAGALEAVTGSSMRMQPGSPIDGLALSAPSAQPFTAPLAAATAPADPAAINTPVTQPGWGDELGLKITWMATQRNQSAELHLNPPQLGPLDVTLKMNGDQATALFTSPHAAVREAIEQALPRLREMLADSGIMLSNAMVSDQSAKNNQDNAPRKAQGKSATGAADNTAEINTAADSRHSSVRRHQGMVDTFA